jgi:RNA methyltransferase, TrmH family
MPTLGRHNVRIKQVRCLEIRKHRQRTGLFFVEGIRLVTEAVQTGASIETLVVAPELLVSPFARQLLEAACLRGVPRLEVSPQAFDTLAAGAPRRGSERWCVSAGSLWSRCG